MKLKVSLVVLMLLSFKSFAEGMDGDMPEGASLFGDFRARYLTGSESSSKGIKTKTKTKATDLKGSRVLFRFRPGFRYVLSKGLSFKGRLKTVVTKGNPECETQRVRLDYY